MSDYRPQFKFEANVIVIHPGLHKTGSSSIQFALDGLRRHRNFTIITPSKLGAPFNVEMLDSLSRWSGAGVLVLSHEDLLGSPDEGYPQAVERIGFVSKMAAGHEIRIIVFVRPQLEFLHSLYIQEIQSGGMPSSPESFVARACDGPFLYWNRLRKLIEDAFTPEAVKFVPFSPKVDSVSQFIKFSGLTEVKIPRPSVRLNISMSPEHAQIMLQLSRSFTLSEEELKRVRWTFQNYLKTPSENHLSLFSNDLQMSITSKFYNDWKDVTQLMKLRDEPTTAEWERGLGSFDHGIGEYIGDAQPSPSANAMLKALLQLSTSKRIPSQRIGVRIARRLINLVS